MYCVILIGKTLMTDPKKDLTKEKSSKKAPVKNGESKSNRWTIFILVFSLLLTTLSAGGLFLFYQKVFLVQKNNISDLSAQLITQNSIIEKKSQEYLAMEAGSKLRVEQVNEKLQQIEDQNRIETTQLHAMQRKLSETVVRHPNDWILSEIDYLIKLSGRKLWLEYDIETAISLLVAADQRLIELGDPSLTPLRKALITDINNLNSLTKIDLDGIVLTLSSLERRINKLRVAGTNLDQSIKPVDKTVSTDIQDWKLNLEKSWSSFIDNFIVINKRDTRVKALLSPEQNWYLKENLRRDVTKAEFATYRRNQEIFDEAITSAKLLLENYYDLTDSSTGAFYKSILKLQETKIRVKYPDQLEVIPVLDKVLSARIKSNK